MAEPGEILFECIGCGTMNPAGAVICAGCQYQFGGPGVEMNPPLALRSAPIAFEAVSPIERFSLSDGFPKPAERINRRPSLGLQFLKFLGYVVLVFLVLVVSAAVFVLALFIAFVAICKPQPDSSVVGIGFGSVLVGSLGFGLIVLFYRWLRQASDD